MEKHTSLMLSLNLTRSVTFKGKWKITTVPFGPPSHRDSGSLVFFLPLSFLFLASTVSRPLHVPRKSYIGEYLEVPEIKEYNTWS